MAYSCKAKRDTTAPRSMLDAMLELASDRGAFKAWEYFFD